MSINPEVAAEATLAAEDELLVVPCVAVHFIFEVGALEDARSVILDFYSRSRALLGDGLTHYSLGDRRDHRPLTGRAESMVPTWFTRPQEDKVYWVELWGASEGVTGASILVSVRWAERWKGDMRAHRRLLVANGWKEVTTFVCSVRMTLPLDHPFSREPARIVDWMQGVGLAREDIVCGGAGLSLNWADGRSGAGPNIGARVRSVCTRYPGFSYGIPTHVNGLVEWSRARDDYVYRIPRTSWVTLVGKRSLDELGGRQAVVRSAAGPGVEAHSVGENLLLVAGPEPQTCDRARNIWPEPYMTVARALAPVRSYLIESDSECIAWVDQWQVALEDGPDGHG